jgi:aspartyl-tRNA synthetase
LSTTYASEIALITKQFPAEPFVWRKKAQGGTLRLRFSDGIALLRGAGADVDDLEDLRWILWVMFTAVSLADDP